MQTHTHLTRAEQQALQNKRAGMFIFQISWIMAFVCLVVVNWQLRFSDGWSTPETEMPSHIPGIMATAALIGSVLLVYRALKAIKHGHNDSFLTLWSGALGLGILFVIIMLYEWFAITTGSQFAQVFRLMTGFHLFHAIVIGGYMGVVYQNGRKNLYSHQDYWSVEAGAKLWYFVLVAWLLFYIVIYWI